MISVTAMFSTPMLTQTTTTPTVVHTGDLMISVTAMFSTPMLTQTTTTPTVVHYWLVSLISVTAIVFHTYR